MCQLRAQGRRYLLEAHYFFETDSLLIFPSTLFILHVFLLLLYCFCFFFIVMFLYCFCAAFVIGPTLLRSHVNRVNCIKLLWTPNTNFTKIYLIRNSRNVQTHRSTWHDTGLNCVLRAKENVSRGEHQRYLISLLSVLCKPARLFLSYHLVTSHCWHFREL